MNIDEGFPFVKVVSLTNILLECIKALNLWRLIFGDYGEFSQPEHIWNSCDLYQTFRLGCFFFIFNSKYKPKIVRQNRSKEDLWFMLLRIYTEKIEGKHD